jgi:hypothetical protein
VKKIFADDWCFITGFDAAPTFGCVPSAVVGECRHPRNHQQKLMMFTQRLLLHKQTPVLHKQPLLLHNQQLLVMHEPCTN